MKFEFDLDIQGIIAKATAPEKIEPLLEKAVSEAIKSAITEATGYRSPLSEGLKAQLKEALPHGLGIDDLAKFQQVFNAEVTKAVHGANAETVRVALAGALENVLPDVPTRIKLSELMEKAREGFYKEKHEAFFAELEKSEYSDAWHLYLDRSENPSGSYYSGGKHSAEINLTFNEAGEVYSMKFKGIDMTPSKTPTVISRFDGLLMCMHTGRTTIEVDIDEDDVKSAAEASYDD